MAPERIFTTGYAGKDVGDLKPMIETFDAILIDIRFAPYSQVTYWRKVYLKTLLGSRYLHVPNLGNRTYKEDKITIQNLELGLETILNLRKNLVLMCACSEFRECHRAVIAEELAARDLETEEITNWRKQATSKQARPFNQS